MATTLGEDGDGNDATTQRRDDANDGDDVDIVVKVVVMCAEEPGSHSITMAYGLGA
jgi:hypothetical protein